MWMKDIVLQDIQNNVYSYVAVNVEINVGCIMICWAKQFHVNFRYNCVNDTK